MRRRFFLGLAADVRSDSKSCRFFSLILHLGFFLLGVHANITPDQLPGVQPVQNRRVANMESCGNIVDREHDGVLLGHVFHVMEHMQPLERAGASEMIQLRQLTLS